MEVMPSRSVPRTLVFRSVAGMVSVAVMVSISLRCWLINLYCYCSSFLRQTARGAL